MNLRAALAKMFGVAAIFAVLAFASTAAEAHGGHVHSGSTSIVLGLQSPAPAISIDKLSIRSEQVLHDKTIHDHDAAELRSAPVTVPAADGAGCVLSCCTGAPCHSSTACTLGQDLSVVLPQDAGTSHRAWSDVGIAGCDPEGIRKPPRFFA